FALKTRDDRGNWSLLSNVPTAKTSCKNDVTLSCGGTKVSQAVDGAPTEVQLVALSENPARSPVRITYAVPDVNKGQPLDVSVFDVLGRRVQTVLSGVADPGVHDVSWDLTDAHGLRVHQGLYFVRLSVGQEKRSRTALVME